MRSERARSAAKTNIHLLQCRHPKLFRSLDVFERAEQRFILYYCWAFLTQRWQLMPLPSTPTATSLSSKPSTVVSADGSRCRYPTTTCTTQRCPCCLNHRRLAMLLTADAAAKLYNGNQSVAWTIEDWQCCWQLMLQLQYVLQWQRQCCLNQWRTDIIFTADNWCRYT